MQNGQAPEHGTTATGHSAFDSSFCILHSAFFISPMSTFASIFGQDDAIDSLRRAYLADRLPHGLIFAGPAGVGKFTTARALGKLFLCEKPKGDSACNACESCRVFDA